MPHAVFDLGSQNATADLLPRHMIPGIEPGGSRVGQPMKPALRILDVFVEPIAVTFSATPSAQQATVYLKLSQELDLTPGLLLPVAYIGANVIEATAVGRFGTAVVVENLFKAQGSVWAPRVVGVRLLFSALSSIDLRIHVDYEMVEVPWMNWFLMWDFLDNITDNELEH